MLFSSPQFWVFFVIILTLVHLSQHRVQNIILLLSSYFFYACWDWRFLSLIILSTFIAYISAIWAAPGNSAKVRKMAVVLSVVINLGILAFFKYYNFFISSFVDFFNISSVVANSIVLDILLPVGISFYTFQAMSYTIDVYQKKMEPTYNFIDISLFVALFPQLVAGPIERGCHLMPQVSLPRQITSEKIESGIFLIVWGLYKKICIADALANPVNVVFASADVTGPEVYVGVFCFAFQIYCDFSGYTDIARGVGRLLGFDLMLNFNLPYFARNPSDFWRRWHISLSSWLKDYLYIPLGGSKIGSIVTYRNLIVTMLLGGLWHGARYNFVLWGLYHGILLCCHRFFSSAFAISFRHNVVVIKWLSIILMFHFTLFGWFLFRIETIEQMTRMLSACINSWSNLGASVDILRYEIPFILPLIAVQIWQYKTGFLELPRTISWPLKAVFVAITLSAVLFWQRGSGIPFIYFQF